MSIAASVITAVAAVVLAVAYIRNNSSPKPRPSVEVPKAPQSINPISSAGSPTAKVAVIQYTDVQCPYCKAFVKTTLPDLRTNYIDTGKVLWAIKHLPLPSHPFARSGAVAVACAGLQGRFWQMHDLLFSNTVDQATLAASEGVVGLDHDRFVACSQRDGLRTVTDDEESAKALHLFGTPTFMFGLKNTGGLVQVTKVVSGSLSTAEFHRILDELVADVSEAHQSVR